MRIRPVASAARMRRVAAIPSSSGMRMSISTTAGSKRAAFSTASAPVRASATTSMSGSPASRRRKPARTMAWSSATRTRMVMAGAPAGTLRRARGVSQRPFQREAGGQHEAAAVHGAGAHLATVDLHPLADADEAMAEAVARRGAAAVVAHVDPQLARAVADDDVGAARLRVLERVRQPLLDD